MRKFTRELIVTILISFLTGIIIDEIVNIPECRGFIPMVCSITSALRKCIIFRINNKKK